MPTAEAVKPSKEAGPTQSGKDKRRGECSE
jgi:hypothetical protein